MKKLIKLIFMVLVVLFLILFLNKNNNYYENENILTQEAIIQFEQDLKEGKDIVPSNYITKKKDYNNKASIFGRKCSNLIEKGVNKVIKKLLSSIEQ
mgnify:CR=1 FL=1